MTLSDLTNNIYIFNLKRRTDRREHIISEMDKIECKNYQIVEAVDGTTINIPSNLKKGMVGLISTYLKLSEILKADSYEDVLIIEDDCVFENDFNDKLEKYINSVPNDWGALYFGANHNYHIGHKTEKVNESVLKLFNSYSAHCVFFKKEFFEELITKLKNFETENDVVMAQLQKKYNCYSPSFPMTTQIPSFSDIENKEVDNRWLIK